MAEALLHLALGPVQDFIAAARRTRDLWFGSHLLSEASKAAARVIREAAGATLIFPTGARLGGVDPLAPADGPYTVRWTADADPPVTVPAPNKLLARVPLDAAAQIAGRADEAARQRWRALADGARRGAGGLLRPGVDAHWDEQIDGLLEVYAAWTALPGAGGFRAARAEVERAVEEAKALRTFAQWSAPDLDGARQSSLDAARYGLLAAEAHTARAGRRLRIAPNEVLSAVDLAKRAGGRPEQFVPVTNVALGPWMRHAARRRPAAWRAFAEAAARFHDAAGTDEGLDRASRVVRDDIASGRPTHAYDAQVFLENRLGKTLEEAIGPDRARTPPQQAAARAVEDAVGALLGRRGPRLPAPVPYVACLVADGDRLGRFLSALDDGALEPASSALCAFSTGTLRIVDAHHGLPIYAGGDDVLALLPVATALACAEALRAHYAAVVAPALPPEVDGRPPTFSVGIGVGHVLDPLGDLLGLGRTAEKLAKGDELPPDRQRDGLALLLEKRGGQRRAWRGRWSEGALAAAVGAVARVGDDRLSTGKLFEVDALQRRFVADAAPAASARDLVAPLLAFAEAAIARSEGTGGKRRGPKLSLADVGLDVSPEMSHRDAMDAMRGWVDLHVIARLIADASPDGIPHDTGDGMSGGIR